MGKPVKNKNYIMQIRGMTHDGQGVGRIDGFAVFAGQALPGEVVEVRIINVEKNYAVAKLLKIVEASPDRREPFCSSYELCGGCSLQHMSYEAQLRWKTGVVRDALMRIGGFRVTEPGTSGGADGNPDSGAGNRAGNSIGNGADGSAIEEAGSGADGDPDCGAANGDGVFLHQTIGMPSPFNYRNKVQYPIGKGRKNDQNRNGNEREEQDAAGKGNLNWNENVEQDEAWKGNENNSKVAIGFYAVRSHEIIDGVRCGIQDVAGDMAREIVRDYIVRKEIPVYDEATGHGLVRHLMVRTALKTGETLVVLVINGRKLPYSGELIEKMRERLPGLTGILLNINTKPTNEILGNENIALWGKDWIFDYIGNFKFKISPLSFFQVNPIQTEVLYNKALEYAKKEYTNKGYAKKIISDPSSDINSAINKDINIAINKVLTLPVILDLYCGVGTISLFMAKDARRVIGVEVVPEAIEDARENARINNINNVEFICGEVEKILPSLFNSGMEKVDILVLDPPRKGCDQTLLDAIANLPDKCKPERIIYISCNPATLSRDLASLRGAGYLAVEAQPVDMFPWTSHVECVVLITNSTL